MGKTFRNVISDQDHFIKSRMAAALRLALLAVVAAITAAQMHGGDHGHGMHEPGGQMLHLIHQEVVALMQAHPNMTSSQCSTKCDAIFHLLDDQDEAMNDELCDGACKCEIDNVCHHNQHNNHHPTAMPADQTTAGATASPSNK